VKRTPLKRRTPLRARKRLRPKPRHPIPLGDTLVLMARWGVNPKCVRCGEDATDWHHVKPKARGGSDDCDNLVPLCRTEHQWVHANSEAAHAVGLLLHSWESDRPYSPVLA
jgi:hypothetical protein